MSIPRDHHYLPQWYLERWAPGGKLTRFTRPRGPGFPLEAKAKVPRGAAFEPDLYALATENDAAERQAIETKFLQVIDDQAARVFALLDSTEKPAPRELIGLLQFVLSLLHRSPSRLAWIRDQLRQHMGLVGDGQGMEDLVADHALELFTTLLSDSSMIERLGQFGIAQIKVRSDRFDLLTSDMPTMMSNGIAQPGGFIMFPADPSRLLIFARETAVVDAFATQEPNALARAVNDAVVRQARHLVIGSSNRQARFVDNRFLRSAASLAESLNPIDGMVRWKVP